MVAHLPESEGYSDSRGIYSARTAVANYYQSRGLDVDVDQVMLGNGVSELISIVLQALLDVDDEVLKDLIAQTLHMDRGANGAPESG